TGTQLNKTQLDSLFTTSKLLVDTAPFYDNDTAPMSMGINSYTRSAESYTEQNNFRNNQTEIAALLDNYASLDAPTRQLLHNINNQQELESLITSLLAPELAADSMQLALSSPYFHVFNHLEKIAGNFTTGNLNDNLYRGQSPCLPTSKWSKREFWFEGYYRNENVDDDSNALGYKTTGGGIMVGVDQKFSNKFIGGLVFGYGNPRSSNGIGRIESDDFTFAVYARTKIDSFIANTFLGYGHQNYDLRNGTNKAEYNGDSVYVSIEFLKPLHLQSGIVLSPLAAIDIQKVWADGVTIPNAITPINISSRTLDQTILRFGINSNYQNLRTKLQYGYQIGGDSFASSKVSFVGGTTNRVLTGVNLGRHNFNAGLGGDFKIGKRTSLFVDYDFDLGERATAHTGQVGAVVRF
ncbi:MAG: autotransporter outer membrane beta-barrel domain-containing protein, partial [Planctomycetaceae bacterium]|nr:autotransporter outer membrane beta-barrel domain-containing protein [Planctomycetaceae bacterium]